MDTADYNGLYRLESRSSWNDLLELHKTHREFKSWMFRGQRGTDWPLRSRLERALARFSIPMEKARVIEEDLLRLFKRHFHRFSPRLPDKKERVEWFALMQHYGAPTRLIDWTYSFWAAVFFAIERSEAGQVPTVWALDPSWVREEARKHLGIVVRWRIARDSKAPRTIQAIFDHQGPCVWPVNPYLLNERLAAQQGVFLAGTDISKPFMANLAAICQDGTNRPKFMKIELHLDNANLQEILSELHRMNISRATLFPGFEGFARHVENLIAMPHVFGRADWFTEKM